MKINCHFAWKFNSLQTENGCLITKNKLFFANMQFNNYVCSHTNNIQMVIGDAS